MSLKIQQASIDDIPVIQYIASIVWPHTFKGIFTDQEISYMIEKEYGFDALQRQMTRMGHHYLLAKIEEADRYIGYAAYELAHKQSDTAKLHKIFLLPTYQSKGMGRILFQAVEKLVKFKGAKALTLNVHQKNKAVGFYEYMGFDLVRVEKRKVKGGLVLEDLVYKKQLA